MEILSKTEEKTQYDLMRLREDDKINNSAILSMSEQKLPDKILDEWIKEVSNKSIDPRRRFSSMMRLLADWRKRIEYSVAGIRSRNPDKSEAMHHYKGFSNDRNAKQNNGRNKSSSG